MGILDRYIGKTILAATFLCLITLVGLSAIIKYVEQLNKVGEGTYDLALAAFYVLLKMPKEIELFFPMAALLGALIGLGSLASSSELVVMQASGMSKMRIAVSVMKTAIPIMLLVMAVGEFLAPVSEQTAKELRRAATKGGDVISSQKGVWAKDKEAFVSIGEIRDKTELINVKIYYFNDQLKLEMSFSAERADYQGDHWLMYKVTKNEFSHDAISSSYQDVQRWDSNLTPSKLGVVTIKPEDMSMRELNAYINYLDKNKQDSARYQLALWQKGVTPFTVLVTMLLALSFIFGPLRSVTMGARILLGIVAGFTFYIANNMFGPISQVFGIWPVVGAVGPSLLFVGLSVYLLRRQS